MRLGVISFSNSLPYRNLPFERLFAPPKTLKKALLEGHLEASLISSAAFLDNQEALEKLPYGIACSGPALSVLLLLNQPLETLNELSIAVTEASETGLALLKILLTHHWKKPFTLFSSKTPHLEKSSGYLLIGDEALKFSKSKPFVYDLASTWKEFSQLPFVFALFALRKGEESKPLLEALSKTLSAFSFEKAPNKEYLLTFDYALNKTHFQGLDLFHDLRQKLS